MPETITRSDAQYAYDIVKTICTEVGPGVPGSSQERARASIIRRELESHLGPGSVVVEEFTLAPHAFLGVFPLSAVFILVASQLNLSTERLTGVTPWLTAAAALTLSVASLWMIVVQYLQYEEFVDRFFRKGLSLNVIGTLRKPGTANVRRLVIVSGHHDSAWENTWIALLGRGLYVTIPTIFIALITIAAMSIVQITGIMTGDAGLVHAGTLGLVLLVYPVLPAVIFALLFNTPRGRRNGGTVPGAADNLSASALAVAMCRFLVENPSHIPDDTEIRFISFGSEEAGLRGSRRYVERHLDELRRLDVRVLNFETVAHPEISILTSDVNGVKNSPEMVRSVVAAADRAGVPYKVKPNPTGAGGSDAGRFSQAGLKAVTLLPFQVPQQLVAFYHQKRDTPEVLTMEPLLNVLKLTLEWVRGGGT